MKILSSSNFNSWSSFDLLKKSLISFDIKYLSFVAFHDCTRQIWSKPVKKSEKFRIFFNAARNVWPTTAGVVSTGADGRRGTTPAAGAADGRATFQKKKTENDWNLNFPI